MKLEELLDLYQQDDRINRLKELANEQSPRIAHLDGITTSAFSFLITAFYRQFKKNHLVILNDKEEAAYVHNDLQALYPKKNILFLPDSFKRPGNFTDVNNHNMRLRTEALKHIVKPETRGEIVVTYPEALLENVVDHRALKQNTISIRLNETIDIDAVLDGLVELGFESTDFVYEPGQFSQRGGVIDIFSFGNEKPYRIELFDTEVESIRIFDPISQISEKKIQRMSIIPNIQGEMQDAKKVSFFKVLPKNTIVWANNLQTSLELFEQTTENIDHFEAAMEELEEEYHLATENFFAEPSALLEAINKKTVFETGKKKALKADLELTFSLSPQPAFNKNFDLLTEKLKEYQNQQYTICITSPNPKQHERFIHIFDDLKAEITFHPLVTSIHQGFVDHDHKTVVFTDHQIFDRFHKYKLKQGYSKSQAINLKALRELQPGDYVTHIDHGVGKFSGLQTIEVNGKKQESVRLVYKDNDVLFVSINALYKISKYTGKEGTQPRVHKLGGEAWQNLKRRTKKKVKDIAKDLIALYAKRKATKGFAFSEDTYLQLELESSFIYEDTPDQAAATLAAKDDMEKDYPMDRLVCGDVGFGKTEIAIRAAFKAVADSKQVAVLVPTTILALQHYKTFKERLKELPCEVDYINRFKSAKQKTETLKKLAAGQIDILIGTHAIVGKKVKFKDLGLLIIDEEQKFGVAVKEKLRALKANVDTLTLTATPIPRTLQFSLMGARDLSIMRTPPPNRQPITTETKIFNEQFLKEAIEFEVYRGGQVFFVHNRVKDIIQYAEILRRIVPDIDIGIAHGQLEGKVLEDTLMRFINKEFDVLLCTNIVEAGLDIPNANTMIVNNAHMFGLSDLHQLRGRVGRSNKKAFCYLLSPPLSTLTTDARKRLQTLEQFSDLGSGFHIAMRDLDIRGAGNILGAEQSGFIADIGLDTFQKILDEALHELKQTEYKELFRDELQKGDIIHVRDVQIDTDVEMRIPDNYVNSRAERMLLYTELNQLDKEEDLNAYGHKIKDRFGSLPPQVLELFDALRLQWLAKRIGFERIILKNGNMRCFFIHNPDSPYFESLIFGRILAYLQAYPGRCQIKQTPKHLSLTFKDVPSMKNAHWHLNEILTFSKQPAEA
ncbi:MAG: transcription-repair coupling factor [Saprospiraceae bacterium]|nr:transcription-repair coupling factor [Saprospiraceae bacterium]